MTQEEVTSRSTLHEVVTATHKGEDETISDDVLYGLDKFANCFLIGCLSVFGIIGNTINILVLCKHGFKNDATNILLTSLSFSDLMFCTTISLRAVTCYTGLFNPVLEITLGTFVNVYIFMTTRFFLGVSNFHVAVIAVERFVAVYFPFHISRIFSTTVMKVVILVIYISCLPMTPTIGIMTYEWVYDTDLNATIAETRLTTMYAENYDLINYLMYVVACNFYGTSSVIIVSICCVVIGWKLFRESEKRKVMTSSKYGYDTRVVKMLVVVCVVYLIVCLPTVTIDNYSYYKPNFIFQSRLYTVLQFFCETLYTLNAAANFVVYVTMSKKFAATYKRMLCAWYAIRD